LIELLGYHVLFKKPKKKYLDVEPIIHITLFTPKWKT
jgi:hypothetical protein